MRGTTIISGRTIKEDIVDKNNGSGDTAMKGVAITQKDSGDLVLRTTVTDSLDFSDVPDGSFVKNESNQSDTFRDVSNRQ